MREHRALASIRRNPLAVISCIILAIFLSAGLFGPAMLPNPNRMFAEVLVGPGGNHLLGTDEVGRDVATLLMYGVRTSFLVGIGSALIATLIGVVIGTLAAGYVGWIDMVLMRVSELFQVMPSMILATVVVALAGPGLGKVIFVIAIVSWPPVARLMRSEVLRVKNLEFVDTARCLGDSNLRILCVEILPNALPPIIALSTLIVGQSIILEAALSFFGLSDPSQPSWGLLLNSGQRFFYQAWWLSAFPGLGILLTVLAFNFLGDGISRAFNPKGEARAT